MSEWGDLRDRAEALIEQSAQDPLTIARTLHHLSMLSFELVQKLDELSRVASDRQIDYEAARARTIDELLERGHNITRARERANYTTAEKKREAEQASLVVDYAKGVLASVNRRHYELMNVGKHVDGATRG